MYTRYVSVYISPSEASFPALGLAVALAASFLPVFASSWLALGESRGPSCMILDKIDDDTRCLLLFDLVKML